MLNLIPDVSEGCTVISSLFLYSIWYVLDAHGLVIETVQEILGQVKQQWREIWS